MEGTDVDVFNGELLRTTEAEDVRILDAVVRLLASDRRLNKIDEKVIDRIVTRFVEQGKHLTTPLYRNLQQMLGRRRMALTGCYIGAMGDPSYGPERAKRRAEIMRQLLGIDEESEAEIPAPSIPTEFDDVWGLCC